VEKVSPEENAFDLVGLVIKPDGKARTSSKSVRRLERFTLMPDKWLPKLSRDNALVALYLQHRAFKEHSRVVKLPNGLLASQGVNR
jgi:hypothetical protein